MIGVIVINYHSEERTERFVREELSKISSEYAVVVVDNGSSNASEASLLEAFKGSDQTVFIAPSQENLGFAKGNNLGAEVARNQFNPDYLLFVNNDIRFESEDVVDRLAGKLKEIPEAAVIGPKVKGLDGRLQSPEPFITFWNRHIWLYWSNLFLSKERKRKALREDYSENAEEGFHYRVSGSMFLMSAKAFFDCGGMDPNTFLFSEEMILSERLKRIGMKVYYYPDVNVVHEHGATVSESYNERRVRDMRFRSECYYYKTYIGVPWWQVAAAKLTYSLKKLFKR